MAVTVVVGGQYGSEGKGKLVAHLAAMSQRRVAVVRCGGTNSGHTVDFEGHPYPFRQLPSAAVVPGSELFLGAGMVIDPNLLLEEMNSVRMDQDRVHVDRNAVILDERDLTAERDSHLRQRVGSTLSGTGSATARKVLRDPTQLTASDEPRLKKMVTDVSRDLNEAVDRGDRIIVEGTQGIGLSLHHSAHFPFVTSRDTSASAFLSEVGLAPTLADEVIAVFRSYPIRVAGNSGPLQNELSWEEVTRRAGATGLFQEYTTVTRKLRRVGEFDWDQAKECIRINRPTSLALHGADYLNFGDVGVSDWETLSNETKAFVELMESALNVEVRYIFTGPKQDHIVDRSHQGPSTVQQLDLVEVST